MRSKYKMILIQSLRLSSFPYWPYRVSNCERAVTYLYQHVQEGEGLYSVTYKELEVFE